MAKFFNNIWFRCISVLLVIAVVLGGLLAVLNDVLYVSPEERTGRAIKKIYGEVKEYSIELDIDNGDEITEYDFGSVNKVYTVGDKTESSYDALFQVTGYQGYKGGTITLWVKVKISGDEQVIDKVILESYDKQTLMSKFDKNYYETFLIDITDAYKDGKAFTTNTDSGEFSNPMSGATYSATAAVNAVNCVIKYLGDN